MFCVTLCSSCDLCLSSVKGITVYLQVAWRIHIITDITILLVGYLTDSHSYGTWRIWHWTMYRWDDFLPISAGMYHSIFWGRGWKVHLHPRIILSDISVGRHLSFNINWTRFSIMNMIPSLWNILNGNSFCAAISDRDIRVLLQSGPDVHTALVHDIYCNTCRIEVQCCEAMARN